MEESSPFVSRGTEKDKNYHSSQNGNVTEDSQSDKSVRISKSKREGDKDHNDVTGEPRTYSIQEAIDHVGFGWFQIRLSIMAGLGWMADSMEMMMLAILGPILHCEWFLPPWQQALLTTLVMVGMMLSSSLWGTFSDMYGRKPTLLLTTFFCGYYGLMTSLSPHYVWLAINRFLVGVFIGAFPQALTLYSEYLPTKSRAMCMVCVEIFFAFGSALEVMLAKLVMPTLGWRYFIGASAVPVLLFPLCAKWLPESARFKLASGMYDDAVLLLEKVAADNKKSLPPGKLQNVDNTSFSRGQIADLFRPRYRLLSIITFSCWFLAGFCYFGIALLVPTLFANPDGCHGYDVTDDNTDKCDVECKAFTQEDYNELVVTGFADIPGLLFIVGLMTFLGRKPSISLCCLLFSVFVFISNVCVTRITLTLFLFTARAVITGSYQAIYVYTSEAYPTHVRSLAIGVGSGLSRLGAVLTPYLAQVGAKQNAYFGITGYGVMGFLAGVIPLLLPFETKGRAMKEDGATAEEYISLGH